MIDLAKVTLRAASDGDRNFGYEVKKAAMRPYIEPVWGWDESFQVEFHRNDWAKQHPQIITLDGRDIGTIEIVRSEAGFHLGEFYLFPAYQRQGIGSELVRAGIRQLADAGCPFIIVLGHVDFYPRFGFRPASTHGIKCEWDVPDDVFMLLVLDEQKMQGVSGLAKYRAEFSTAL